MINDRLIMCICFLIVIDNDNSICLLIVIDNDKSICYKTLIVGMYDKDWST